MKLFRYLMLAMVAMFTVSTASAQEVVSWKHKVEHVKDNVYRVTFEASIQDGWHIYDLGPYQGGPIATSVAFEKTTGTELSGGVVARPAPKRTMDDTWRMEIGYFYNTAVITQDVVLKGDKGTLVGMIEWQSCTEESCLPPGEWEFEIEIKKVAGATAPAAATETTPTPAVTATTATATVATAPEAEEGSDDSASDDAAAVGETAGETQQIAEQADEESGPEPRSLWSLLLEAIVFGLVALITPCVFPMVPVTVSFFMKGSENKAAARLKALSFGLFIIILYVLPVAIIVLVTFLFGGDAGVATAFNWFATHWAPNLIFFIVFMVFAVSFFGAFEITLPSSMINKSDSKADKKGLVGVFFMALTLVLVSFSCTGPLISNVIVSAATGSTEWWQPIVVMGAFATVFAIPFTLLAFLPSLLNKVKSGSWLNAVKVSLGFVEIALGFKFLMVIDQSYLLGIFSREFYIAIWVACGILWVLYLLGVYKTKHDSPITHIGPVRLMFAIGVMVFTVWLIPGLWGAPLKTLSGYMPPMSAQTAKVLTLDDLQNMSFTGTGEQQSAGSHGVFINPLTGKAPRHSNIENIHSPAGFTAFFDVDEAMEYAKHVGKPLFIDITGNACVNCREMEQSVWTDPTVARLLRDDFVMVCVFMDVKYTLPEEDWVVDDKGNTLKRLDKINMTWSLKNNYGVAQPVYVMVDPRDGKELGPTRAYNKSVSAYVAWLQAGLETYKGK